MIYYAHSMKKYDTAAEKEEEQKIYAHFDSDRDFYDDVVYNPNNGDVAKAVSPMDYCLEIIKTADILCFSTCNGYYVGKGVYREVEQARRLNIPVYLITETGLVKFTGAVNVIDRNWHTHYAKVCKRLHPFA